MFGPNLFGARVRLTAPSADMIPSFVAWLSDTEVTRYMNRTEPPSPDEEREWLDAAGKSDTSVLWAVFVGEKLIGTLAVEGINWRSRHGVTGTLFGAKEEWGKGYATEAQAIRSRYAFEELGLEKLKTRVFAENVASLRALEKGGYRQCGLLRREEFRHGRWHDMWLGELLREEWQERQT